MKVKEEKDEQPEDAPKEPRKAKKEFSEEKIKLLREEKVRNHIVFVVNLLKFIYKNIHPFSFQGNELRNKHHIIVTGTDIPAVVETFDELVSEYEIPQQIVDNLAGCGYATPTPVQMQAIPIMTKVGVLHMQLLSNELYQHSNSISYKYVYLSY